jgi:prepilin-type N-terminal cleavage/methylation domain-containing protein
MMNHGKAGRARKNLQGFTLIEIAMVLVIVGLMMGGIMGALGPQLDNKKVRDTQERIKQASEAIMAFAIANRRLPCPASGSPGDKGDEQPPDDFGECPGKGHGYVPARTLGLGERDPNKGFMQDAWGFGIRYAVTQVPYDGSNDNKCSSDILVEKCNNSNSNNYKNNYNSTNLPSKCLVSSPCYPFTQPDGIKNAYYNNGRVVQGEDQPSREKLLQVCASSTGTIAPTATTPGNCGTVSANLVVQPAFIVWSTARNGATPRAGISDDEDANQDGDHVYVSHSRTETSPVAGAKNTAFDDLLQWRTYLTVFQDMTKMGILP